MWKLRVCFLVLNVVCLQLAQANQYAHNEAAPMNQYNPYSYGYDFEDNYGNKQWRQEKSHNPMEIHGTYGYSDKNGIYREVNYVADKNGFRATVKTNEPGLAGSKDPASVKIDSYQPVPVSEYRAAQISGDHRPVVMKAAASYSQPANVRVNQVSSVRPVEAAALNPPVYHRIVQHQQQ